MKLIDNIPVWGEPVDESALSQIKNCARTADAAALMADHHKGYAVPIGGVVAYRDSISPSGVGFDIACGNKAVLLDVPASEVRAHIRKIMDDIWGNLSFGIGLKNKQRVDHELFDDPAWKLPAVRSLKDTARAQLGTIGSGNHYVDLFEDEQGRAWIGVHFGSRGLGHKTATFFLNAGGAQDGMDVDPLVLSVRSNLGGDYLACMHLAGRYAYAGRDWVCSEVARMLGANILEEVHNHHNYAWRETHNGGIVGCPQGSDACFPRSTRLCGRFDGRHLGHPRGRGVGGGEVLAVLHRPRRGTGDEPHRGARQGQPQDGQVIKEGAVSREMMMDWIRRQKVELRGAGTDESPHCYKRLPEVLGFHGSMVRILHTLTPIGVAMAGEHEFDPYKD